MPQTSMKPAEGSGPASRLATLPPGEPKLTLGWEAWTWCRKLTQPNGPRAGLNFEPTVDQIRFLLWWYAIDREGRWLFNHGARRLAKGSGKSPFAAVLALIEFCAPVRLARFDTRADGGCIGKPVDMPLVQIAATAESQTANTMRMVRAFAPKGSDIVREYNMDPGKTRYYKLPEGTLEVITSSATAAEGSEASFIVADEALALDTPLPTPNGWTTVEAVRVGDALIGSSGPVTVTHVTPVFSGRPCYRVVFDDGTAIVADEGHLWQTALCVSAALPKVRTTRQMAEDGRRFKVPRMAPLVGVDVPLPVDPYLLGVWLGDGASRWAGLTVGDEDLAFVLNEAHSRGVPLAKVVKSGAGRAATISLQGNANGDRYTKDGSSFRGGLVTLDVLNNKHIPACLLRASRAQRLDFLRGLMDTDGHVGPSGSAVFVNSNRALADGVAELVRTFGYSAYITSRADSRWDGNPIVHKVTFRPDTSNCPFLLPRKARRVREPSSRRWKTIKSIELVASVPVKCIEVDSADHLFVAGEGWALTHNTEHWKPSNGGVELAATLADNLAKSGNRMLETSNAWVPGAGTVAEATYEAWLAQEEGRTRGEQRILYDARIAPPDTVMSDPVSLRTALEFVYGDCDWKKPKPKAKPDVKPIMERIWSPRAMPDDSKRKYLNWPTAAEDAWLSLEEWTRLADTSVLVDPEEPVVLFFDGSKSKDATALIGCTLAAGHIFTLGVWEPNPNDENDTVDAGLVDLTVMKAFEDHRVVAFFADVREWEQFALTEWPQRYKDQIKVWAAPQARPPQPIAWDMRGHAYDFAKATEACYEEIQAGAFTHDGHSAVARHMANARRRPYKDAIAIGKESPGSPRKIDAAVCVIGARMVRRICLGSGKKFWLGKSARVVVLR